MMKPTPASLEHISPTKDLTPGCRNSQPTSTLEGETVSPEKIPCNIRSELLPSPLHHQSSSRTDSDPGATSGEWRAAGLH